MKPQADFGKTGLADGLGGDHLGQKEHCLGDSTAVSLAFASAVVEA